MSNATERANTLWKSSLGFSTTNKDKKFFQETEPFSNYVDGDQILLDKIPTTFTLSDPLVTKTFTLKDGTSFSGNLDITETICKIENIPLTYINLSDENGKTSGAWTSLDNSDNIILTDVLQFNLNKDSAGNQPYLYELFNLEGTTLKRFAAKPL